MQDAEQFSQKLFDLNRPIELSIAGGEPTLSPQLKPLIKLYKDRGHSVFLTSNGSRSTDYWRDIKLDYLCLSYHPSWAKGDWLERAQSLLGSVTDNITVRIMMDPEYWDQCLVVYQTLLESELNITAEPVKIQDWGAAKIDYNPVQNQWLDSQQTWVRSPPRSNMDTTFAQTSAQQTANLPIADFERSGHNRFPGWRCNIGLDSLFVQFDGSLRRGNCHQDGYIGWIQDPNFQLPAQPVICSQTLCHCATDIKINKQRLVERNNTVPVFKLKIQG